MRSRALLVLAACIAALGSCDSASSGSSPREPDPPQTPAEPQTPQAPPDEPMPARTPQTHPSGFSDAQLLGDDADDALDELLESMTDADTRGIRIDAPFSVPAQAAQLPVLGAFVRRPEAGEAFENRVVVIATSGDAIAVEPALRTPKMKGGTKSPPTDAVRGSSFSFDARTRLGSVDFSAGARLWVAYGAFLSNGVTVRVGADAPLAPAEGEPLSLRAPALAPTEPGGVIEVAGTAPASKPVHIVALGGPEAFVVSVEATAEGEYAINLLGDNALPKAPGTWHVYAFSGEHAAGPATLELTPGSKPW